MGAIVAGAGAAGGLASGALGLGGTFSGILVGAAVGGTIAGTAFEVFGLGSFKQGFVAGAIAGGIAGWNSQGAKTSLEEFVPELGNKTAGWVQYGGAICVMAVATFVLIAYKYREAIMDYANEKFSEDAPKDDTARQSTQGTQSAKTQNSCQATA